MKYFIIAMLLVACGGCSLTTSKRVPSSVYHQGFNVNDPRNFGGGTF